jgi:quercetin dioxygenase-like cupin family protein
MRYSLGQESSLLVRTLLAMGVAVSCLALTPTANSQAGSEPSRVHQVFEHPLPQLDGGHLKVIMRLVTYAPGESSQPHSHPCPVIGYVLEGALRIHIEGSPETTYHAGDTFFEAPNGIHQTSKNTSDTKPARLLAYFVCDREGPLTIPLSRKGSEPSQKQ